MTKSFCDICGLEIPASSNDGGNLRLDFYGRLKDGTRYPASNYWMLCGRCRSNVQNAITDLKKRTEWKIEAHP